MRCSISRTAGSYRQGDPSVRRLVVLAAGRGRPHDPAARRRSRRTRRTWRGPSRSPQARPQGRDQVRRTPVLRRLARAASDTLLLDMRLFTKVVFSPSTGAPTQVTVGPGVALKDVSKMLRDKGVVIPHGECPLVNLGGHVQTGGIGHQLRSLGVTVDWVRSFKMVTRDPQSPPEPTFTWSASSPGRRPAWAPARRRTATCSAPCSAAARAAGAS